MPWYPRQPAIDANIPKTASGEERMQGLLRSVSKLAERSEEEEAILRRAVGGRR